MKKYARDKYLKARGGTAKILTVFCTTCNSPLIEYQKDGKGRLLRCYLNRILSLHEYGEVTEYEDGGRLICNKCSTCIGTPMMYTDGRKAIRLRQDYCYKRTSENDDQYE